MPVSASVTLRVKAVVLVTPPPVDVTVTRKLPAGVDPAVMIVSTVEQAGVQDAEEKLAVAPDGSPEALKVTDLLLPKSSATVIEFVTEDPATTDLFPEFARAKLKTPPDSCWKMA